MGHISEELRTIQQGSDEFRGATGTLTKRVEEQEESLTKKRVMVLIDGHEAIFPPSSSVGGMEGGLAAAKRLRSTIGTYLWPDESNPKLILHVYVVRGTPEPEVDEFIEGFNQGGKRVLIIDAGPQKENKIKALFKQHISSPQIFKVVFGGCHNNTYGETLGDAIKSGHSGKLVLFSGYANLAEDIEKLGLPALSFDNKLTDNPVQPTAGQNRVLGHTELADGPAKASTNSSQVDKYNCTTTTATQLVKSRDPYKPSPLSDLASSLTHENLSDIFTPLNPAQSYPDFENLKILDLDELYLYHNFPRMPSVLEAHDVLPTLWTTFVQDVAGAWNGQCPPSFRTCEQDGPSPKESVVITRLVETWNLLYFIPRGVEFIIYEGRVRQNGKYVGTVDTNIPEFTLTVDDIAVSTSQLSEDDTSEDDTSEDDISEDDISEDDTSEDDTSDCRVSGDLRRRAEVEPKRIRKREEIEKNLRRRLRELEKSYALYVTCLPSLGHA